jgi:hypothetical protein
VFNTLRIARLEADLKELIKTVASLSARVEIDFKNLLREIDNCAPKTLSQVAPAIFIAPRPKRKRTVTKA